MLTVFVLKRSSYLFIVFSLILNVSLEANDHPEDQMVCIDNIIVSVPAETAPSKLPDGNNNTESGSENESPNASKDIVTDSSISSSISAKHPLINDHTLVKKIVAASLATTIAVVVTYPLDLARVRKQVGSLQKGNYYKGVLPYGVALCTTVGLGMGVYDTKREDGWSPAASGALGSLVSTTISTPLWVYRTRNTLAPSNKPYLIYDFLNASRKNPSLAFTGIGSSFAMLPFSTAFYYLFDQFNRDLTPYLDGDEGSWKESLRHGLAASGAKVFLTGFTYPLESLRTSRETEPAAYLEHAKRLYTEGKVARFYQGFPVATLRLITSTSIYMGLYPSVKRLVNLWTEDTVRK